MGLYGSKDKKPNGGGSSGSSSKKKDGGGGGSGGSSPPDPNKEEAEDLSDNEVATITCFQSGTLSNNDDNTICPSRYKSATSYKQVITYSDCSYNIQDQRIIKYAKENGISDLEGNRYIKKVDFNLQLDFEDCGITGPTDCTYKNLVTGEVKLFNDKKIIYPLIYKTPPEQPVAQSSTFSTSITDISKSPVSEFKIFFGSTGGLTGSDGKPCGSLGLVNIKYRFETTAYLRVKKLTELVDILYDDEDLRDRGSGGSGGSGGGSGGGGSNEFDFIRVFYKLTKNKNNYWIWILLILMIVVVFLILQNNKIIK